VMEATGIYYENLAYFLNSKEKTVSVHLAQKIKYFAKSCNLKTKTDKVDSKMIAEFGIEKNLTETDLWTPPSREFKLLRDLSRERSSLKKAETSAKLQLHAMRYSHDKNETVIEMKEKQIAFYKEQVKEIEKEIKDLVKKDKKLFEKIKKIETIKGVGFVTIITVITEVNGFLLFKNIPQLISYAGLDVVEKESGKFVGKTKISKKGNANLRTALYMPAISAIKNNKELRNFNDRVMKNKTLKKQGIVAVMRKILILIYTLWNTDQVYIEDYQTSEYANKQIQASK
jgi:transposase